MSNLRLLYLDDNQLKTIAPDTFPNGLVRLHLSGNQLSEINSDMFQARRFQGAETLQKELTISQNNITSLPENVSCRSPHLQELNIADNQFRQIDLNLFANLKQLKVLNISKNYVKHLRGLSNGNQLPFCDSTESILFPNLMILDLSDNQIQMIEEDVFKEMPKIETIIIRKNPLRRVDKKTFASLKKYYYCFSSGASNMLFHRKRPMQSSKPKEALFDLSSTPSLSFYQSFHVDFWYVCFFWKSLCFNVEML